MEMRGSYPKILLLMVMVVVEAARDENPSGFVTWNNNYYTTWGHQALVLNETSELHLTLDHNSGLYLSLTIFLSTYVCVLSLYVL